MAMKLSIVLPTYNESNWLPETVKKIDKAIENSSLKSAELLIIDDGSTDDTETIVAKCIKRHNIKIKYIKQKNSGRFLARKKGVDNARYDTLLFIDSRVHIHKNSLRYVEEYIKKNPEDSVWNAHVYVEKKNNVFARFWDVVTCIAWRRYFSNPKHISYGLKDFDYYPKGTTCFLAPTRTIKESMRTFATEATDLKRANDDTLLIKSIVATSNIHISPQFNCVYHARSTLKKFLNHAYHRGQVFVDGFLHKGNRYFYPLVSVLAGTLVSLLAMVLRPSLIILLPVLLALFMVACGIGSRIVKIKAISWRDSLWFTILSVPFAAFYLAGIWKAVIARLKKSPYFWAFAIYLAWLLFIYRGILGDMSHRVINGPSDATGLMWLNHAYGKTPWWQYTHLSNYPVGENLWNPLYFVSQLIYIPYWALSKIFGSIPGYYILEGIGFIFSAMMMFAFLRWLLKSKSFFPALFGGLAVSFTPYLIVKSTSHPSYVFNGILTGLLWLLLLYVHNPNKRYTLLIGVLMGALVYFDPYFVLLAGMVYVIFWVSVLVYNKFKFIKLAKLHAKNLLLSWTALIIVSLPGLLAYRLNLVQTSSILEQGRGDTIGDAVAYAARVWEYVLPPFHHPLAPYKLRNFENFHLHGSNFTENTLYLGVVVSLLALVGFIVLTRHGIGQNFMRPNKNLLLVIAFSLIIGGFLFSLPPYFHIGTQKIFLPSYLVISITSAWRVFARLVLLIQMGLAIFSAVGIQYIFNILKSRNKKILFALVCTAVLFFDYLISLPVWNLNTAQPVYGLIKSDKSIDALAEYPLLDPPQGSYFTLYTAYQLNHNIPSINSNLSNSNYKLYRGSLANLNNWQTVRVLRAMGIDMVIVHTHTTDEPSQLKYLTRSAFSDDEVAHDKASIYPLGGGDILECVVVPSMGFDGPSTAGYSDAEYFMHKSGKIELQKVLGSSFNCDGYRKLNLDFYTFEKRSRNLVIKQGENVLWRGQSNGYEDHQLISIVADASKPIEIIPDDPPADFSLVLSNMIAE